MSFVDRTNTTPADLDLWPWVVIPRADIEAEVERRASLPKPEGCRRRCLLVHPRSEERGLGLAPGIQVAIEVLLPGEETDPIRHNSSVVSFCIEGAGTTTVDRSRFAIGQYDVVALPSMAIYSHRNDGPGRQVRLTYSNAALLEKMNVHIVEDCPVPPWAADGVEGGEGGAPLAAEEPPAPHPVADLFPLGDEGAHLMSYERLINPPVLESKPLHWPWQSV